MSPEQTSGEQVDNKTDIWSLAVVLFEMLAGQLPFKGEYGQALTYSILNEDPIALSSVRSGLPLELEQIINKCLEKQSSHRYQGVDELIVDLQRLKRNIVNKVTNTGKAIYPKKSKNPFLYIGIPILVILLAVVGYISFKGSKDSSWKNSIAVLPFEDISPQKDQEHICDGITTDLITKLTNIEPLKVIGWNSVKLFKNTTKDIKEIGSELEVANILTGTLLREEDNIRINASILRTEDRTQIWSERYDEKYSNTINLQDDISQAIAEALMVEFTPEALETIKANRPQNVEAFEFREKARIYNRKFIGTLSEDDFKTSENLFKTAIISDPNYAQAYSGLADLYNSYFSYMDLSETEKKTYIELQEKYINIAMDINPDIAAVQGVFGFILIAKGEIDKAFVCFKNAYNLNPRATEPNVGLANLFWRRGLINLAITYFSKVLELDPLHLYALSFRARCFYLVGEFEKAQVEIEKVIQIEPNHLEILKLKVANLLLLKKYGEAEDILVKISNINQSYYDYLLALKFAVLEEKEKALSIPESKNNKIYSLLDMKENAINLLNEESDNAEKKQKSLYLELKNSPFYDNIRNDVQFQEILDNQKKLYDVLLEKYGDV